MGMVAKEAHRDGESLMNDAQRWARCLGLPGRKKEQKEKLVDVQDATAPIDRCMNANSGRQEDRVECQRQDQPQKSTASLCHVTSRQKVATGWSPPASKHNQRRVGRVRFTARRPSISILATFGVSQTSGCETILLGREMRSKKNGVSG